MASVKWCCNQYSDIIDRNDRVLYLKWVGVLSFRNIKLWLGKVLRSHNLMIKGKAEGCHN